MYQFTQHERETFNNHVSSFKSEVLCILRKQLKHNEGNVENSTFLTQSINYVMKKFDNLPKEDIYTLKHFLEQIGSVIAQDRIERLTKNEELPEEIYEEIGIDNPRELYSLMETAAHFRTDLLIRHSNPSLKFIVNKQLFIKRNGSKTEQEYMTTVTKDMSIKATTKYGVVISDAFDSKLGHITKLKISGFFKDRFKALYLREANEKYDIEPRVNDMFNEIRCAISKQVERSESSKLPFDQIEHLLKESVQRYLIKSQRTDVPEIPFTSSQILELVPLITQIAAKNIYTNQSIKKGTLRKVVLLIPVTDEDKQWMYENEKITEQNGKMYIKLDGLEKIEGNVPSGILVRDIDGHSFSVAPNFERSTQQLMYDDWYGVNSVIDKAILLKDENLQHGFGVYDPGHNGATFPLLGISRFGKYSVIRDKKDLWEFKKQTYQKFPWYDSRDLPLVSNYHVDITETLNSITKAQRRINPQRVTDILERYTADLAEAYTLLLPKEQKKRNKENEALTKIASFITREPELDTIEKERYDDKSVVEARALLKDSNTLDIINCKLPLDIFNHINKVSGNGQRRYIPAEEIFQITR